MTRRRARLQRRGGPRRGGAVATFDFHVSFPICIIRREPMPTTRALRLVLFLSLLLLCGSRALAQAAQSPLPAPTGYVNDYADVIDSATKQRLETILTNLKEQQNIEFAVVT